jgi:carbonic anhydrase
MSRKRSLPVYSLTIGVLLILASGTAGPARSGFKHENAKLAVSELRANEIQAVLSSLSTAASAATITPVAHWGYAEENGPDKWAELDPTFSLCGSGMAQTPINFTADIIKNESLPTLLVDYSNRELEVENNGHTVQATISHGGVAGINIGAVRYDLVQFHFHTNSEHLVDGKEFPLELHLVHRASDGSLAVLGAFIVAGHKHAELDKVFSHLPQHEGDHFSVGDFNLKDLLPAGTYSFRYGGSLTTPACSEGVNWTVLSQPIEMATEQIQAFKDIFSGAEFPHGNRRPVQPLNGRSVGFSQVINFDVCLQDDRTNDVLQFSSTTGDYKYTRCGSGSFTLAGRGIFSKVGSTLLLRSNNVSAAFSLSTFGFGSGKAAIRPNPFGTSFSIVDSSLTNNTCGCP